MKIAVLLLVVALATVVCPQSPRFKPPETEKIQVAVLVSDGAVMIDFAGPWEVFSDVMLHVKAKTHSDLHPFHLYTVAASRGPIRASGGMRIVPDFTFADAPRPNIVVIPAQNNESPVVMAWIRKMSKQSDLVMSVCTGAFLLAKAGVLDGKSATTHHEAYGTFEHAYPAIALRRKMRYVQSGPAMFTAGGLSSGIDLALHVVDLYYGHAVAEETARHMEYEGKGWEGDGTAAIDFSAPAASGLHATLDNLSNKTYENPSTEFTRSGKDVEFSFSDDPRYKGALADNGNLIEGTLFMDNGAHVPMNWKREKPMHGSATDSAAPVSITGDWTATLDYKNRQARFVLHIQD